MPLMRLITPRSSSRRSCRDSRAGENISRFGSSSARRMPAMLTLGFCRACSRALSPGSKKLDPLDGLAIHLVRLAQAAEGAHTGGEVVQRGQVSEIAPVAANQYLAQVDQAVNGFLERRDAPGRRPVAVFHLSVVLEEGHVVGGGLDAQYDTALIIRILIRALAEKRCFTQVPSMRVENRRADLLKPASSGADHVRPRNVAICSALTPSASTVSRMSCS